MKRDPIQEFVLPDADGASATDARSWRIASAMLALTIAWIVGLYWTTVEGMVAIWARSETFAHGFIVAPISMWLIWRVRSDVTRLAPSPAWWVLFPMAAVGVGWLLGELGAVNALAQFSFVAMLILAVPAVLGARVAWTIVFPLGFLFFAVPVGEFGIPKLMEWTADVLVTALQVTGIPVFREGQTFVIPSGRWSVVEACSGVRYLIASLVLGSLYAYLSYRSVQRRLVFVAFSIVIPVVANWVRAYMIVILGHVSGNKLAAGVDHLIYGWLFFGVVILLMFWVGGRWRDDEIAPAGPARGSATSTRLVSPGEFLLVAAMVAVVVVVWPIAYRTIERNDVAAVPAMAALGAVGAWSPSANRVADWQPRFRNPSLELHQTFRRGDAAVGVYVDYFRNQGSGRKLVSSDNVLVTSENVIWTRVASGTKRIVVDGQAVDAVRTELKGPLDQRLVVWQWYWIDGRLTASDAWAKGYTALSRLMGRGDDGAIIVVYAPKGQSGAAAAALDGFVRDVGPSLMTSLARVRDQR